MNLICIAAFWPIVEVERQRILKKTSTKTMMNGVSTGWQKPLAVFIAAIVGHLRHL
jgi:hypothetical protein